MTSKPTQRPTPDGFTPPDFKSEYVAYAAEPYRTGNPETGEATDFRPSVFVREYPQVKVASVERKTKDVRGEQFAYGYVVFDAASLDIADYTRDFGASVQVESPAFALLEEAHKRGAPVYAALETVRKQRGPDGKIAPTAYIHDLRGAQKDGNKADSSVTGNHCFNVVAAVGVPGDPSTIVVTGDTRSAPAEWPSLRKNRDHTLPPTGWRIMEGGIAPSATSGGDGVDVDAVAEAVAQRMGTHPSSTPPRRSGPVATEGKPWEPLNSDGRVNLASYLVSRSRFTFEAACTLLTERTTPASDPQQFIADAWSLTDLLLWMADTVQSQVTGGRPNRSEGSHKEAARWCALAYDTLPGTPAGEGLSFPESGVGDQTVAKEWADRVVAAAVALFSRAAAETERHIRGDDVPAGEQAPQSGDQPAQAATPAPEAPATQPQADPQATPQGGSGVVADDPSLVGEWEALLAHVGQADHPERFGPVLIETFGAGVLAQIDAGAFRQQIGQWKSDPASFNHEAAAAFGRAREASAPA